MATTARRSVARSAAGTAALIDLLLADLAADFDACDLCTLLAAELFWRLTEDGTEVHVCEHCADTADVSYVAD